MTAQILRGAGLSARLRDEIDRSIIALRALHAHAPRLATILVGSDPSAEAYRASIERTMQRVGIQHQAINLPVHVRLAEFVRTLEQTSNDPETTGVMVLMPLPEQLPSELVHENLSPLKDVDGITPTNAGRLHMGLPSLRPSTPQGGIELLDHYGVEIEGRHAVIVGRSNVVGRPLASLLLQRNATVTICHRRTVDLASTTRRADILAVAAGHAGLVTDRMVKPGSVVLDFGVNVADGKVVGDADFDSVSRVAGGVTPVPGGTGPVTALVLARNTVAAGFAAKAGTLDEVEVVKLLARSPHVPAA